jgi:hypothetical protein
MKCPYAVNVEQANQNTYQHDDNGNCTFHEHKLVELKFFVTCLESECAVWVNGRCNYNQGVNS